MKIYYLVKRMTQLVKHYQTNRKEGNEMMIKLYAINIVAGRKQFKDLIFPKAIKEKIKTEIRLMVDDDALFDALTSEGGK